MVWQGQVGIESLSFYTSHYYLDLKTLALERGLPPDHFAKRVGQEQMAAPPPGEDAVTLGANAASQALTGIDAQQVTMLVFATESGIDQSKAGGIYVHSLLGLPSRCRVFEIKQACYGATAGIRLAIDHIRLRPEAKVLVVASDVARYGLGSAGEPTQGAGSLAMVLSANPRVLAFDPEAGLHTEDVMDFWRPNYRDEALVDGKASVRIYLRSLDRAWQQYAEESGRDFGDLQRFCYHLPFTRMADIAHKHLAKSLGRNLSTTEFDLQLDDGLVYNRRLGNSYTASLYIGLASLLENADDELRGQRVGLFSYGSGCMAEYFSGAVTPGYHEWLLTELHRRLLAARTELDCATYEQFYNFRPPTDGGDHDFPEYNTGRYRLLGLRGHRRIYAPVEGN